MATDPNWGPVDDELAQLLADDPSLVAELVEFDRAYKAGEAELTSDEEVRCRLEACGIPLAPR